MSKQAWQEGYNSLIQSGLAQEKALELLGNRITGEKTLADLYNLLAQQLQNQVQLLDLQTQIAELGDTIGTGDYTALLSTIDSITDSTLKNTLMQMIEFMKPATIPVSSGPSTTASSTISVHTNNRNNDNRPDREDRENRKNRRFASGTPSVPYDMVATIHKKEMIIPSTF